LPLPTHDCIAVSLRFLKIKKTRFTQLRPLLQNHTRNGTSRPNADMVATFHITLPEKKYVFE
jgi:hypothetical protein